MTNDRDKTVKILLGGSFDPLHCGHVETAKAIAQYFGNCVDLVPNNVPVHKHGLLTSAEHRLEMVHRVCDREPLLRVEALEFKRRGLSYTIDTLATVRQQEGQAVPIIWCLGNDAFAEIEMWHDWQALLMYGHLLVLQRPGYDKPKLPLAWRDCEVEAMQLLSRPHGCVARLSMPQFDVSATVIRETLGVGKDLPPNTIPKEVADYIVANGLYASLDCHR